MSLESFLRKPLVRKLTGFKHSYQSNYHFKWGSINTESENGFGITYGMSFPDENKDYETGKYKAHLLFRLFKFTITIQLWYGSGWNHDDTYESIGFHFSQDEDIQALILNYKSKTEFLYYPWSTEFYKRELLAKDGITWIDAPDKFIMFNDPVFPGLVIEKQFTFYPNDGEVQHRTAWVRQERMFHKRRCMPKIERFMKIYYRLNIDFNEETGNRVGKSWKGGTLSISAPIEDNESVDVAFARIVKNL